LLSVVCGHLFYQNNNFRNQISVLEDQLGEYQNQTGEMKKQIDELEQQNLELQNQIRELEQQNLELQNHTLELESLIDMFTNRVNIIEFSSSGFNPVAGLLILSSANITIQNLGINKVEGLTLIIPPESLNGKINIDVIRPGETQTVSTVFYWYLGQKTTVTLKLGKTILDEYPPP
jgi:predicted RNase H-like nuclease (RuvC/YqgF family)